MSSITLKPNINELYTLNKFILNELPEENLQVNLIDEEIFVNIAKYSKTELRLIYINSALTMEFVDNGIEFNPPLKRILLRQITLGAKIGGLGIF